MKTQHLYFWLIGGLTFAILWGNNQPVTQSNGFTTRASVSSQGIQGDNLSRNVDLSGSGQFITFSSFASTLVENDTNNHEDVFVHDLATGITILVSISSSGVQANGDSSRPKISNDGRFIAFTSTADNLVEGDGNGKPDLFIHDLQDGKTILASINSEGIQSVQGVSINISISPNGNVIAFASSGSDIVSNDTNGAMDIFVRNIQLKETVRVSLASAGTEANNHSANPSLSEDGRFIAYQSIASNLVEEDMNNYCDSNYDGEYGDNCQDIFVHDQLTGETVRVSLASAGTEANNSSWEPAISADGRFIAFSSFASNLVENDHNFYCDNNADGIFDDNCSDIFVHDLQTGETARISISSSGEETDGGSLWAAISADGRYIAFESWATNLVENDTNTKMDIFIHDRWTNETQRVSLSNSGVQGIWGAYAAALSADGRYVGFETLNIFTPNDSNYKQDVYVRFWQPHLLYFPLVARPSE